MFRLLHNIIDDIVWPLVMIVSIWVVFFYDLNYGWELNQFGVRPQSIQGLIGIITMPFLHGDIDHLFANSIPFLVGSVLLFHLYPKKRWHVVIWIWLVSGTVVWLIGDPRSVHVGVSGVVYGLIAFLLASGFFKKSKTLTAVTMLLIFLYGSLIWGIFPDYGKLVGKNISWEGHLAGALTGVALAFIFRKHGPADDVFFEDEDDDDDDDDDPNAYWKIDSGSPEEWTIRYRYRTKE
jgi:membrane associated rhomboid family serine protease